jgi:hypothetical protein
MTRVAIRRCAGDEPESSVTTMIRFAKNIWHLAKRVNLQR